MAQFYSTADDLRRVRESTVGDAFLENLEFCFQPFHLSGWERYTLLPKSIKVYLLAVDVLGDWPSKQSQDPGLVGFGTGQLGSEGWLMGVLTCTSHPHSIHLRVCQAGGRVTVGLCMVATKAVWLSS